MHQAHGRILSRIDRARPVKGFKRPDWTIVRRAAAPSLFYADWVHPFAERSPALHAYRARLLARSSVARAVDEARPYRPFFPLGAPDRD